MASQIHEKESCKRTYIGRDSQRYIERDSQRYIERDSHRYIEEDNHRYIEKDIGTKVHRNRHRYID